jgi:hypothetical protein
MVRQYSPHQWTINYPWYPKPRPTPPTPSLPTRWCPPNVISCFINPMNTSSIHHL